MNEPTTQDDTPDAQPRAHRVTWFGPPDRPVEGNTVYIRPPAEATPLPGPAQVQR
jgi:hypothetical protein